MVGWRVALGVGAAWCVVVGAASGQGLLRTFPGLGAGETTGNAVAGVGDLDGDGYDDVAIGAKLALADGKIAGCVRVRSGKDGSILREWCGTSQGEWFGNAVAGVGDVNGDQVPDVLIGAPNHDAGGVDAGRAYLFSGADGALLGAWNGDSGGDWFGFAVSEAGDVDLDGTPDLFVGAWRDDPNDDFNAGAAHVFSGADHSTLYTWFGDFPIDELGYAVDGGHDVDADGHPDLVAAILDSDTLVQDGGGARVFSGKDGSILGTVDGDWPFAWNGYSVASPGDLDGDGHADFVVGAPHDGENGALAGKVRVYSGKDFSLRFTFKGAHAGAELGWAAGSAGDVDGDGRPDFAITAPKHQGRGLVEVRSGATGELLKSYLGVPGSEFGYAVDAAGDLNGNGAVDIVIGAAFEDVPANNAGVARVYAHDCGTLVAEPGGCPGGGGFQPQLAMSGCATPLGTVTLEIAQAAGNSVAVLLFGTGSGAFPLTPSCALGIAPLLLPTALALPLGGSGPGAGSVSITVQLPALSALPVSVAIQAVIGDAAVPAGLAVTGAVRITVL